MVNGLFPGIWTELMRHKLCLMGYDQENRKYSTKSGGSPRLIISYKTYDIFEFEIEKCEVVESEH